MRARSGLLGNSSRHLLACAMLSVPCTGHAENVDVAGIHVGVPAGFADLNAPQTLMVDLFYHDRRVGQVEVLATSGAIRFLDPQAVIGFVHDAAAREDLQAALANTLVANEQFACHQGSARENCGKLAPRAVGVILDRDRFRLDLFVNPALLTIGVPVDNAYIEPPDGALSLINAVSGSLSGSSNAQQTLTLQDRLIVASGKGRFVSDVFLDSNRGVQADQALLQADIGERRYSAGLLYSAGADLVARRKLLGLGVASQIDTRRDKELLEGTPLVVTLGQRAKVEILQAGKVLSSRIYEPGNQWLDTRHLPAGSYDIVLRIAEVGQPPREERRFFTRNIRIAQAGHDVVFAYAGLLSPERSRQMLAVSHEPYLETGYARRIAPSIAVDAEMFATRRAAFGQIGANAFAPLGQVRLAGLASTSGAYGGLAQVTSQGSGAFGFTFDLRRIVTRQGHTIDGLETPEPDFANPLDGQPLALRAGRGAFSQITSYVGYNRRGHQFGLSGSYRQESGEAGAYRVGPSVRWDLSQRGPWRLALHAEGAFTDHGRNGFMGLSLVNTGWGGHLTSRFGVRHSREEAQRATTRAVGFMAAAAQVDDVAGGRLDLGAGLERDEASGLVNASASLETPHGAARADLIQQLGGQAQYALGFRTLVTATRGKLALQGNNQAEGALTVEIDGARKSDRFEVLVDEAVVGVARSGDTLAVPLSPYRQYGVRIRPVASGALGYDPDLRQVSLYPGSVARLVWQVEPKIAAFGRLQLPNGEPVRNAIIRDGKSIAQTDDRGYFQMEVTPMSKLDVVLSDGRRCEAAIMALAQEGLFSELDTLVCTPVLGRPTTIAARPSRLMED